jgi:hypothetical protein
MSGWQTIDSAPKDGTEFIACNMGFQPFSCVYHDGQFIHIEPDGEIIAYPFTHWMHLPAPPEPEPVLTRNPNGWQQQVFDTPAQGPKRR